jgi:hypothetical protein
LDRCQISFVKFILEAYDNVALVSTLDPRLALVKLLIAPGCESMVDEIMTDLGGELRGVPVDDAHTKGVSEVPCRWPTVKNG